MGFLPTTARPAEACHLLSLSSVSPCCPCSRCNRHPHICIFVEKRPDIFTSGDHRLTTTHELPVSSDQTKLNGAIAAQRVQNAIAPFMQDKRSAVRITHGIAEHRKVIPTHIGDACAALIPAKYLMCVNLGGSRSG
jgi:hypothetical protein